MCESDSHCRCESCANESFKPISQIAQSPNGSKRQCERKAEIHCYFLIALRTLAFIGCLIFIPFAASQQSNTTSGCRMELWVYETLTECKNLSTPTIGYVNADGMCNSAETATVSANQSLLPGTYRAQCTAPNENGTQYLRFIDSGCMFGDCSSTIIGADTCTRDTFSHASLYSGLAVPDYPVHSPSSKSIQCSRLEGSNAAMTLTFIIFGNCSDPSCTYIEQDDLSDGDDGGGWSASPTSSLDTVANTSMPVSSPTSEPTLMPSLIALDPTAEPTPMLSIEGTLESDDVMPTRPNNASYRVETISVVMLLAYIDGIIEGNTVTIWENVTALHIHQSAILEGYTIESILTDAINSTSGGSQQMLNEEKGIISGSTIATLPPGNKNRRTLQETSATISAEEDNLEEGTAKIHFDVKIIFPNTTPITVTALRVFHDAFSTEVKRTQYIFKLVSTHEKTFSNVNTMTILDDGSGHPLLPPSASSQPIRSPSTGSSNDTPSRSKADIENSGSAISEPNTTEKVDGGMQNTALIVAVLGSALFTLFVACGYYVYHRGKRDALSQSQNQNEDMLVKGRMGGKISATTSSSNSTPFLLNSNLHPRWTNEIIIDPSGDDVSTLGGSVLLGFGNGGGLQLPNNGEMHGGAECGINNQVVGTDEPTASVNIDFDFSKNRYRTGALNEDATIDDVNTRYTKESATAFTTLSRLGIMGAATGANGPQSVCFADDDMSFERQYQEGCTTDEDADDQYDDQYGEKNLRQGEQGKHMHTITNAGGVMRTNSSSRGTMPGTSLLMMIPSSGSSPTRKINQPHHQAIQPSLTKPLPGQQQPVHHHAFEVKVPPGILGMVVDTPSPLPVSSNLGDNLRDWQHPTQAPVVRAIRADSVLAGVVQPGDWLIAVDSYDCAGMSAMQVSNLISTRSHLHRTLRFVRTSNLSNSS